MHFTPNTCEPLIDQVIDNYRLLDVVGQGGMGCVYKARDEKMGRIVALKLLRSNLGAFTLREGKALGQLNHSNIVNVFYMGEAKEGVFIVMEFVDGNTLHEFMSRDVSDIIPVMKQSLLALEHAHNAGVIHRDIKPSNIMVSKAGQVKVMDFGLAKVESPDKDRTVTRLQAGTISYMSPEQVRGLQHVSQLSDIYSIGKTFYHILARRLPFDASESDQYSILKAIIERQFKPPSHYNRDVPRGLDKIIMKAIEKEPSQRYKSAREMYKALEDFEARAQSKYASKRSSSQPTPVTRLALSKKQWTWATAFLLVFLSITAFTSWYSTRETQPSLAEQASRNAQSEVQIPLINENSTEPIDTSKTALNAPPPSSTTRSSISIASTPSNSIITLGELTLPSPVSGHSVEPGRYTLTVKADGYDTFTEVIAIESDTSFSIDLLPQGRLVVDSSVPRAIVRVNGNVVGRTPINQPMARGAYMVVVSAEGYSTYSTQVRVQSRNDVEIIAPLRMLGMLTVNATAGSDIFINNSKQATTGSDGSVDATLSPGSYQVRISHPDYGTWEKEVSVNEGKQQLDVDFTKSIKANISANVLGASIFIDGIDTGEETPARVDLGVGNHRIEVRKDGYTVEPSYIDQLIEGTEQDLPRFAFQLTREEE